METFSQKYKIKVTVMFTITVLNSIQHIWELQLIILINRILPFKRIPQDRTNRETLILQFKVSITNKIIKTIVRVGFHNMPENRPATDFNHRLRAQMSLFTDSGPKTTCKYYCFHECLPSKKNTYITNQIISTV